MKLEQIAKSRLWNNIYTVKIKCYDEMTVSLFIYSSFISSSLHWPSWLFGPNVGDFER